MKKIKLIAICLFQIGLLSSMTPSTHRLRIFHDILLTVFSLMVVAIAVAPTPKVKP